MKTGETILVLPLLLCIFCAGRTEPTFVEKHGFLSVRGTQLVDSKNEPVVLAGMSFGWHNWWPQFWNRDAVKILRDDWKCNVLRAAMGIEHEDGFLEDPDSSVALVKAVVDACIENGIYVIIDWHDHHAHLHQDQAKAFFSDMARIYGRTPNVIYEIYNEPTAVDWKTVKAYSEAVISTIREIDPDNLILVGSPHWSQDVHTVADDPITGYSNLMYTVHFYAGTHKAWLRERGDFALEKGIPLFISEFGACNADGNGPNDIAELKLWTDWMDKNRLSWCNWSIADKNETCSVLKPKTSPRGPWTESDLKESGLIARELIQKWNIK